MSGEDMGGQVVDHAGSLTGPAGLDDVSLVLLSHCTVDGLVTLVSSEVRDVQRAAIVCLGLKGSLRHCEGLVGLLRHDDLDVVQLAEGSLWRIWMRAGSEAANRTLAEAVDLIRCDQYRQAVQVLERLTAAEPTFAEAHNQRGIALCLLDQPEQAAGAFENAWRLNRHHFSAVVSLGHTSVERGDLKGALEYYRHALELHPWLEGIAEVVERLEVVGDNGSVSR